MDCKLTGRITYREWLCKTFVWKRLSNESYAVHTITMISGRNILMTRFMILWVDTFYIYMQTRFGGAMIINTYSGERATGRVLEIGTHARTHTHANTYVVHVCSYACMHSRTEHVFTHVRTPVCRHQLMYIHKLRYDSQKGTQVCMHARVQLHH